VPGHWRPVARTMVPLVLIATIATRSLRARVRIAAGAALVGLWAAVYRRYRATGRRQTADEYERLCTANWEAFSRHYNERVPTITEEFELWGSFHQHRHEMRYDLVADAVRAHAPRGGQILDLGCGSGLVAERLQDVEVGYVGLDLPSHQVTFAAASFRGRPMTLETQWVQGSGELLPFSDASFDVVVMTEVIEHLLQPERAVWEVARVLKPGGSAVRSPTRWRGWRKRPAPRDLG